MSDSNEKWVDFAREAVRAVLETLADGKAKDIKGENLHAAMVLNVGQVMAEHGVAVGQVAELERLRGVLKDIAATEVPA